MPVWRIASMLLVALTCWPVQESPHHASSESLGKVSFPISCSPAVQQQFDRAVALLHSFAYSEARKGFHAVSQTDPKCAMAHWGAAMSYFQQLWDPPIVPGTILPAQREIRLAQQLKYRSDIELQFIAALALIFDDPVHAPYAARAGSYEHAMSDLASKNPRNLEAQVFYALALLANASPADKAHARQKQAADVLEPLARDYPQHPGIPHYLIHAYDNAELAAKGLPAARAYSLIAPAAPHSLHMPSHIFTRLGLWDDSIACNVAAQKAARQHGDTGEELHAMDYLVYAYLQTGREDQAALVIRQLKRMTNLDAADFKMAYASAAMPVRVAVERQRWADASTLVPPANAPPHVVALAVWARGLGLARAGRPTEAQLEAQHLQQIAADLHASDNSYWAAQVEILTQELTAWIAQAKNQTQQAVALLRAAADKEDAIEKLPVTPGPVVPAREQLGSLLLEQNQPAAALKEFNLALTNAPGRRNSLQGAAIAAAQTAAQSAK